jgi:homoserine kinase
MALDIWNEVSVEPGPSGVTIQGEGAETLERDPSNLVYRSMARVFQETGTSMPELAVACRNAIPLARGLGSSSAAVVGGLVAGNALCGDALTTEELLRLAVEIEGHPDNVAPALLGGCQIVTHDGDTLITAAVPIASPLKAVLFIPDQAMPTAQARALLPSQISRDDAVFNMARTALLVGALATGSYQHLRVATQDRLHQPPRQAIFPAMPLIFRAALAAGALGVFLSGAGSTILALSNQREMTIGYEMADIGEKAGVHGTLLVVDLSPTGAHVVKAE